MKSPRRRLVAWAALIGAISALGFAGRFSGQRPPSDAVFRWDTFGNEAVLYAIVLAIVLAIARGLARRDAFALRPPCSWAAAARVVVGVLIVLYVVAGALDRVLHAGREQGLTTSHWEPRHAAAFAANYAVLGLLGPAVEELTFRGLGFRLLERFGSWTAIILVGIAFGLWHGLVFAFPILALVGAGLAYVRWRTGSLYPCIVLHALFNTLALVGPFVA